MNWNEIKVNSIFNYIVSRKWDKIIYDEVALEN
jgi:hypothetical protein